MQGKYRFSQWITLVSGAVQGDKDMGYSFEIGNSLTYKVSCLECLHHSRLIKDQPDNRVSIQPDVSRSLTGDRFCDLTATARDAAGRFELSLSSP